MANSIGQYYRQQFPDGIRLDRTNPESVVYKVDEARIEALNWFYDVIKEMGNQLQVRTATIALDDYEAFLKIPKDLTLTYSERRARIMVKFAGYPATLGNIKSIAKEITGVDVEINEYGIPTDTYYDSDKCWKIRIFVDYNLPGIKTFKRSYFESIMKEIFPAHTEWESDSFVYLAPESYLAPVSPSTRTPLILGEGYVQTS